MRGWNVWSWKVYLGINVVSDDANDLTIGADVASHVILEHGDNLAAIGLVFLGNVLAAQETGLLGAVPMEFDGALGLESILHERSERFQDGDGAAAIILK